MTPIIRSSALAVTLLAGNILHVSVTLLLLPFLQQTAMAQGDLIFNGGFDTSSNDINPDGWTLTGGAYFNVKTGNPPPDVIMAPDATASQTVYGLTAGDLYMFSGNYQDGGTDTTDISFEVLLNGTPYFETAVPTNLNWQTFSFLYTATSSSVDLSLWQTMGSYLSVGDYSIDNIAMYVAPEPASLPLICVGGIMLTFFSVKTMRSRARSIATDRRQNTAPACSSALPVRT